MKTLSKLDPAHIPPGPTQISVQNFTTVRCAVIEFIMCTRYVTYIETTHKVMTSSHTVMTDVITHSDDIIKSVVVL